MKGKETIEVFRKNDTLEFGTKGEFIHFFNLDTTEGYNAIKKRVIRGWPIVVKKTEVSLAQKSVEKFKEENPELTDEEFVKALSEKYGVTENRAKTSLEILKRRLRMEKQQKKGRADLENYKDLLAEVVVLAIKDYRSALKVLMKNPRSIKARSDKIEIEMFFLKSNLYTLIAEIPGKTLIRILQEQTGYTDFQEVCNDDKRRTARV